MTNKLATPDRRQFIARTLQVSAGSMLAGAGLKPVAASAEPPRLTAERLVSLPESPTRVLIQHESGAYLATERTGGRFTSGKAEVWFEERADGTAVHVACPNAPLSRVIVRWETRFPEDTLFLGDAWERSYGDLQWRFLEPERVMPWYFAAHQVATGRSFMLGVKTQPSAMCFWTVDGEGICCVRSPACRRHPSAAAIAGTTPMAETSMRRRCGVTRPFSRNWRAHTAIAPSA